MHMDMDLKLELQQKLLMTPEMRQAIAILQISSQELNVLVNQALTDNPLLEAEEAETSAIDIDRYYSLQQDQHHFEGATDEGREYPSLEAYVSQPVTLEAHLRLQLEMHRTDNMDQMIGFYLIGCLDEKGYLAVDVDEIAHVFDVCTERVDKVLKLIQLFDPPGIGARNLQECLTLQAVQRGLDSPHVLAVINEYLDDVARGRIGYIAGQLGISCAAVQDTIDIIKRLNPKPAVNFTSDKNTYIYPDVQVQVVAGELLVIVNSDIPPLYINPEYKKLLSTEDAKIRDYITKRFHAALWLIKSIQQRQQTLYNIMTQMVELQPDFFLKGPGCLRPMTLRDIAEPLGIHESTVSRAAANKYVHTPYGLFAIKSLFTSGVKTATGEMSREIIKQKIKDLINSEQVRQPLSDQQIAECLNQAQIFLSRRTVAKYRDELGIPSAKLRRRY